MKLVAQNMVLTSWKMSTYVRRKDFLMLPSHYETALPLDAPLSGRRHRQLY
jgi:hypothetical protein